MKKINIEEIHHGSPKTLAKKINEIIDHLSTEKSAEPKVSEKNWRAEIHGHYWKIDNGRVVRSTDSYDGYGDYNYNTLNYFKTRAQAEAYKEYQLAIGTVTRAIWDANGEWEPKWGDDGKTKTTIYYHHHEDGGWEFSNSFAAQDMAIFPYMKDQETAEQIIADYTKELECIRNYKR